MTKNCTIIIKLLVTNKERKLCDLENILGMFINEIWLICVFDQSERDYLGQSHATLPIWTIAVTLAWAAAQENNQQEFFSNY